MPYGLPGQWPSPTGRMPFDYPGSSTRPLLSNIYLDFHRLIEVLKIRHHCSRFTYSHTIFTTERSRNSPKQSSTTDCNKLLNPTLDYSDLGMLILDVRV